MSCLNIRKIKKPLSLFFYMVVTDRFCTSGCVFNTGIYIKLQAHGKSKTDEPLHEIHVMLFWFGLVFVVLFF